MGKDLDCGVSVIAEEGEEELAEEDCAVSISSYRNEITVEDDEDSPEKKTARLLRKLNDNLNGYRNQTPGGRKTGNSLLGLQVHDPRRKRFQGTEVKLPSKCPTPILPLHTAGLVQLQSRPQQPPVSSLSTDNTHVCVKVHNASSSDPRVLLSVKVWRRMSGGVDAYELILEGMCERNVIFFIVFIVIETIPPLAANYW
eukprot:m.142607 g.142607  ORF g.142607 m.142607 type:complete len:199 (+) comp13196_c2_seq9:101-697(+)